MSLYNFSFIICAAEEISSFFLFIIIVNVSAYDVVCEFWLVCSSGFFVAMKRHYVQGSLQKRVYWRLAYTFEGLSSWLHGDEHDSRKAGLVLEQSGAESLHMIYKWQAERERERNRGWPGWTFETSKSAISVTLLPTRPHLIIFPKTVLPLRNQAFKDMSLLGSFSSKPAQVCACHSMHVEISEDKAC